ncbi:MAG: YihY/virulence factor BrkB family protein [Polyangiaceae bacterium]
MRRKVLASSNSVGPPSLRSARTWKDVVIGFYDGLVKHRTTGLAAEVSFFALVSIPPTLLAFFGALGFVGDAMGSNFTDGVRDEVVRAAHNFLTRDAVDQVVTPMLDKTLRQGHFDILSIGLLVALFAASRWADALISALNVVYDVDERLAMWRRRALAVVLTLAGIVTSVVLFPLLIAGPRIVRAFKPSSNAATTFATIWDIAYWPVTAGITVGVLTAMYHFATPFRTKYRRDLPGAVFAFLLWVVGSWALRAYARWSIESSPMYGSLAAPLVVLGWLYFTSFAVLMGAEVNSVVEILWPAMTRKERRAIIRDAVQKMRASGADVDPVTSSVGNEIDVAKAEEVLRRRAMSPPPLENEEG